MYKPKLQRKKKDWLWLVLLHCDHFFVIILKKKQTKKPHEHWFPVKRWDDVSKCLLKTWLKLHVRLFVNRKGESVLQKSKGTSLNWPVLLHEIFYKGCKCINACMLPSSGRRTQTPPSTWFMHYWFGHHTLCEYKLIVIMIPWLEEPQIANTMSKCMQKQQTIMLVFITVANGAFSLLLWVCVQSTFIYYPWAQRTGDFARRLR